MRLASLALVASLAIGGIAFAQDSTSRTVTVGSFNAVDASAGTVVTFTQGPQNVTMTGAPQALERMRVEVRGSTLYVGRKSTMGWGNGGRRDRVEVRVSAPSLVALDVSSGAVINATGVTAGSFKLGASSGGSVRVAGQCSNLDADVSSGGSANAGQFICSNVTGDASSGGSLNAFANSTKNGSASSGGSVRIAGPGAAGNVTKSSGGSVSLTP